MAAAPSPHAIVNFADIALLDAFRGKLRELGIKRRVAGNLPVLVLFYILYAASVSGSAELDGQSEPGWLGFVFGLAFLLGGIAAIIQTALTKGNPYTGDFPATAPR